MYRSNDICIVGKGSVFPGTWNSNQFVSSLFAGQCFISDLRTASRKSYPWDINLVYNPDRKAEDQCYSTYGAHISRVDLKDLAQKRGWNWNDLTSLEIVCMEALLEATTPIRDFPGLKSAEIILGLSAIDAEFTFELADAIQDEIYQELQKLDFANSDLEHMKEVFETRFGGWKDRKPTPSYMVAATLTERLKQTAGLRGPACLIDAACASSLAAFHIAVRRLKQYESDLIIVGGADVSVSPGCHVYFSRLGAMSPEANVPFDSKAAGLTQGEGAGFFALMRLQDAIRSNLKIFGVIKACEGSSDGRSSGIVEPTAAGQLLAYQRAYSAAGVTEVDYIEAHGTGTQIGDRTEVQSLSLQFPKKKIPIGSVKANIGHTIAAAGAAGLMKCLGVLEKKTVPPSTHFKSFPNDFRTNLFLNKKEHSIARSGEPLSVGLSSFGFGGANFHMVVQEYVPGEVFSEVPVAAPLSVVVCGERSYSYEEIQAFGKNSQHRLPPNVIPRIEKVQLLTLQMVEQVFKELKIAPRYIDREKVSVISATMLPLEGNLAAGRRTIMSAYQRVAEGSHLDSRARAIVDKAFTGLHGSSLKINEDTLSGFLNNIVAARVCNAFDFKGVNFNVDAEHCGYASALRVAKTLLSASHGMVILVYGDDESIDNNRRTARTRLGCTVLANATYALEHDLPIEKILQSIVYSEIEPSLQAIH